MWRSAPTAGPGRYRRFPEITGMKTGIPLQPPRTHYRLLARGWHEHNKNTSAPGHDTRSDELDAGLLDLKVVLHLADTGKRLRGRDDRVRLLDRGDRAEEM